MLNLQQLLLRVCLSRILSGFRSHLLFLFPLPYSAEFSPRKILLATYRDCSIRCRLLRLLPFHPISQPSLLPRKTLCGGSQRKSPWIWQARRNLAISVLFLSILFPLKDTSLFVFPLTLLWQCPRLVHLCQRRTRLECGSTSYHRILLDPRPRRLILLLKFLRSVLGMDLFLLRTEPPLHVLGGLQRVSLGAAMWFRVSVFLLRFQVPSTSLLQASMAIRFPT